MSIFGFYFVKTLLEQLGWPKRKSLFSSKAIVDTLIVDETINQMIDWSAALGACRPKLALQIIAWMFDDKDWEGDDAPNIVMFINESKNIWNARGNNSPHDAIQPLNLSKHFGNTISIKDLKDNRIGTALEQKVLGGLLWGLANSEKFKSWYQSQSKENKKLLPTMQEAGVQVDSTPTLEEFLKESEEMLKGYENEIKPLPPIPAKLLADARTLGINISN